MKKSGLLIGFVLGIGLTFGLGSEASAAQAMHRLYNPNSGEHFYTKSFAEKIYLTKAGWKDEGLGWRAPDNGANVYRVYNPYSGDHHYTLSLDEKDGLVKAGWKDEGVGWYSDQNRGVPLYRAYNPNAHSGSHHYTVDQQEQKNLINAGWKDEGIAWYGVLVSQTEINKKIVAAINTYYQDLNGDNQIYVRENGNRYERQVGEYGWIPLIFDYESGCVLFETSPWNGSSLCGWWIEDGDAVRFNPDWNTLYQ